MLPEALTNYLMDELAISIQSAKPVSGGSINQAYRISANEGILFLKFNAAAPDDFFEKEAHGLRELQNARAKLRIPNIAAVEKPHQSRPGFLLMEFINHSYSGDAFVFGAQLARLHQNENEYFGLEVDNYIGSLPQKNERFDDWVSFFIQKRIEPQLKMAVDSGKLASGVHTHWGSLATRLEQILPPCKPSLLHGDLWSGNYFFDENGMAVLIDPAVYYGHPEVDLAFSKMFGGFSSEFYEGYESISPLESGFSERVPIYNLYPLLVHVNLFGGHYVSQFKQIIHTF